MAPYNNAASTRFFTNVTAARTFDPSAILNCRPVAYSKGMCTCACACACACAFAFASGPGALADVGRRTGQEQKPEQKPEQEPEQEPWKPRKRLRGGGVEGFATAAALGV